ncbi:hypothetical protein HK101_000882 [Irineochytrium annulatum]|nr:hypothetical protein HK101_000882 [Irineochytrium annulatum]
MELVIPAPTPKNPTPNGFVVLPTTTSDTPAQLTGVVRITNPDRNHRYIASTHLSVVMFIGMGPKTTDARPLTSGKGRDAFDPEAEKTAAASVHARPIAKASRRMWVPGNPGEVPSGTHDYPFSIDVDSMVPPTITDQSVTSTARDVTCVVYAILKRPNEDNLIARREVTLRRGVSWTEPRRIPMDGTMFEGQVRYTVVVPELIYIGDTTAAVNVALSNLSGGVLQIRSVQCTWVEVFTYEEPQGKPPTIHETIFSKTTRSSDSLPSSTSDISLKFDVPTVDASPDCDYRASSPHTHQLLRAYGGAASVHHELRLRFEYKPARSVAPLEDRVVARVPFACVVQPGAGGGRGAVRGITPSASATGAAFGIGRQGMTVLNGPSAAGGSGGLAKRTSSQGSGRSSLSGTTKAETVGSGRPSLAFSRASVDQHTAYAQHQSFSTPSLHSGVDFYGNGMAPMMESLSAPCLPLGQVEDGPGSGGDLSLPLPTPTPMPMPPPPILPHELPPPFEMPKVNGIGGPHAPLPPLSPPLPPLPLMPASVERELPVPQETVGVPVMNGAVEPAAFAAPATEEVGAAEEEPATLDYLIGMTKNATAAHEPENEDEMRVNVGDMLFVRMAWVDGFAFGNNLTTRDEGIFPQSCMFGDPTSPVVAAPPAPLPAPLSTVPTASTLAESPKSPRTPTAKAPMRGVSLINRSYVTSPTGSLSRKPAGSTPTAGYPTPQSPSSSNSGSFGSLSRRPVLLNQHVPLHPHIARSDRELEVSVVDIITLE